MQVLSSDLINLLIHVNTYSILALHIYIEYRSKKKYISHALRMKLSSYISYKHCILISVHQSLIIL